MGFVVTASSTVIMAGSGSTLPEQAPEVELDELVETTEVVSVDVEVLLEPEGVVDAAPVPWWELDAVPCEARRRRCQGPPGKRRSLECRQRGKCPA